LTLSSEGTNLFIAHSVALKGQTVGTWQLYHPSPEGTVRFLF